MALSNGGRRWIEFVVELASPRGWRVLRTFRDLEACRQFLVEQPAEHAIEFIIG